MSIVTSTDPSTSPYGKYRLKGSTSSDSGQIAPIYTNPIQSFTYGAESYLSFTSEELPDLSCASTPRNSVNSDPSDSDIKSKLRELERALLSDDDDDNEGDNGVSMEIDSFKNMLLHETTTPEQLLFSCATLVSEGNDDEASTMISELRDMVTIQGDPKQRIAAYMVEGLAARLAASGKGIYRALKCKEPPTADRLSAMQVLFEVCPCFRFGFLAANSAIQEATRGESRIHIVDFDVNQGSQYITLIQALAARKPEPPYLRITGVDDPESVQRSVGGLNVIGMRLEKLAEALGMAFDFRAVAVNTEDLTPAMLATRPGEALVVNFAFQLHHMPDESVSTVNHRDRLLRLVKSMRPKLVTVVEQDVNTNTSPFLPRFVEAYKYYSAVFESLDATLPRESAERMNVERHCLARDIVNIVACEGEERIERYEVAGKWRARMTMAGFEACPLSPAVKREINKEIAEKYCGMYKVREEGGALQFGWADKFLIVASAWR